MVWSCIFVVLLCVCVCFLFFFFFQAEDGIRDWSVTGVQTCALPICRTDPPAVSFGPDMVELKISRGLLLSADFNSENLSLLSESLISKSSPDFIP